MREDHGFTPFSWRRKATRGDVEGILFLAKGYRPKGAKVGWALLGLVACSGRRGREARGEREDPGRVRVFLLLKLFAFSFQN
jgi:hypothetical protein